MVAYEFKEKIKELYDQVYEGQKSQARKYAMEELELGEEMECSIEEAYDMGFEDGKEERYPEE